MLTGVVITLSRSMKGLHDALHNVEWRGEDTVKLIFLIADAPPHLDYAQDYDYGRRNGKRRSTRNQNLPNR